MLATAASCYAVYHYVSPYVIGFVRRRSALKSAQEQLDDVLEAVCEVSDHIEEVADECEDVFPDIDITQPLIRKRSRKPKHRGSFRAHLMSIAKAKFGCPKRTLANTLCIRKFLYDYCVEQHVLPRHIAMNIDFAVESVFVPSQQEIVSRAVGHTKEAKIRGWLRDSFGGPSLTC